MVSSPIPPAGHIPPQFLKTLVELDADVNKTVAAEKTATKKMAGVKAKAVTGLKQTLKKRNKEFENVLETYNKVSLYSALWWRLLTLQDPAAYVRDYEAANVAPPTKKIKPLPSSKGQEVEEGQDENFSTVGRGGRVKNFTDKDVLATLKEIAEQRGRKVSFLPPVECSWGQADCIEHRPSRDHQDFAETARGFDNDLPKAPSLPCPHCWSSRLLAEPHYDAPGLLGLVQVRIRPAHHYPA